MPPVWANRLLSSLSNKLKHFDNEPETPCSIWVNESKQVNKQTNNNQVKRNKQVNKYISKQAGAELCQAQVKLKVRV